MAVPALARNADNAAQEDERLKALSRYDILDTPEEAAFARVAELVRLIFKTESSVVSLIDAHRQWYKAADGSAAPGAQVPLPETFCRTTIEGEGPLIVPDATKDDRFADNPHVTGDAHVRFYAGIPLTTPDGFKIGTICAFDSKPREFSARDEEILASLSQIAMNELELRQLATVDTLTGIMSRRAFKEDGLKYVALAKRHRSRLSAVTFDIDHFKAVNDTYGHAMGDKVLVAVARQIGAGLRKGDLFGRLGGEEFAVLLPDADAAAAFDVAEKFRNGIRSLKFPGTFPALSVSASFGISLLDPGVDDLEGLLVKADEALYEAKNRGRNRSFIWHGTTTSTTKQVERRRVLKAGRLVFNNKLSVMDCTVRALWDDGAEVSVGNSIGIPDDVVLQMKADGFEWKAEVVQRKPTSLELAFK